jgi:hypothetical protein
LHLGHAKVRHLNDSTRPKNQIASFPSVDSSLDDFNRRKRRAIKWEKKLCANLGGRGDSQQDPARPLTAEILMGTQQRRDGSIKQESFSEQTLPGFEGLFAKGSIINSGASQDTDYFGFQARSTFYSQVGQLERANARFPKKKAEGGEGSEVLRESLKESFVVRNDEETSVQSPQTSYDSLQLHDFSIAAKPQSPRSLFIGELLPKQNLIMEATRTPPASVQRSKTSQPRCATAPAATRTALKPGPPSTIRSGIIIRNPSARHPPDEINLSYQGIGDVLGLALARSLRDLPNVRKLNVWECQLTDESLGPILKVVRDCPTLTSLNLGGNKMDTQASEAMGNLFAMSHCPLRDLGLSKADIDDGECCELVGRLKNNKNLTKLDVSYNLIGAGEVTSLVDPTFQTGAQAIAGMLRKTDGLVLESLNLSWNAIRRASARCLGESLSVNMTLVELDLSFNGFGDEGGLAIGGALFTNRTLRKLNIASNSISARAAFTIAVACRHNQVLEVLNLQGNPIGKVGGQSLMLVPVSSGERLSLHLRNCDMLVEDSSFILDKVSQLPREPGDLNNMYSLDLSVPHRRAMGLEILRLLAETPGFTVEQCSLNERVLKLQRAAVSGPMEESDDDTLERLQWALTHLDETWEKFDADRSGTLSEQELSLMLQDLGLDSSHTALEHIFATYDCDNSGMIEAPELAEFLECCKDEFVERSKPRPVMVEASPTGLPSRGSTLNKPANSKQRCFTLPSEGTFTISLGFKPTTHGSDMGGTTTSGELRTILDLANKTDDPLASLELSFGHMRLHLEQAQELVRALLPEIYDVVKVLARVLPCMVCSSHAQVLVTIFLRDNFSERRRLEVELGPAFGPLMGYTTGHYILNLMNPTHRIALVKLAETSSLESKKRRHNRACFKDTSQKGNWSGFRNERFKGSPIELKPIFFNPLGHSGIVEFDFVSTYRPSSACAVLSNRRFSSLVEHLGWLASEDGSRDDEEARSMMEFLENESIADPVVMEKDELFLFDHEMATLRGNKDIPELAVPAAADSVIDENNGEASESSGQDGAASLPIASIMRARGTMSLLSKIKSRTSKVAARPSSMMRPSRKHGGKRALVTGDEMNSIRDLVYARWFTAKQALWVLQHCPVVERAEVSSYLEEAQAQNRTGGGGGGSRPSLFGGGSVAAAAAASTASRQIPDNPRKVDLAIFLFPRIFDLCHFDLLLGAMSPRDRARVTHRLGWLNIFNPHRAEQGFALDLREREDRILIKILVHLSVIEPGENVLDGQFGWDRCVDPVPGWFLPQTWFREDGMPTKGSLKLRYYSGQKHQWVVRSLRTALMDVVLASPLQEDLDAFALAERGRSTVEYIAHSLTEVCAEECGEPIEWTYDIHAVPSIRPWETQDLERQSESRGGLSTV